MMDGVPAVPAAVIFDNDGLTLDTEVVWTRAEARLFERRGATFTHEHKLELVGSAGAISGAKLERMLGAPAGSGPALMAELHELLAVELEQGCAPMPGAVALLDALAAARVPVALCSNSPRRFVDLALAGSGLGGAFAITVAGDEVAQGKPAPDPYLAAAALLGAAPAGCTALEDSPTGATSARAAGMRVLGVPSVPGVELGAHVDVVHPSLEDPALWLALGLTPAR
jgi:beta-phosphoglucomutase-like phosphatase (HAD superfamily)